MSKWTNDIVLDTMLDKLATGTILTICTTQPTNRTEAVSTYELASSVLDSGDFSKSDGDVNGRKLTVSQQTELTIDNTGTSNYVALCDGTDLLAVTTCASQVLTAGNKVTTTPFSFTVSDPV